jgi:hypothetical protein
VQLGVCVRYDATTTPALLIDGSSWSAIASSC